MKNILNQTFRTKLNEAIKGDSYLERIGVHTVDDFFSEKVCLSVVRENMLAGVGKMEWGFGVYFKAIFSSDTVSISTMLFDVDDIKAMVSLYPGVQF